MPGIVLRLLTAMMVCFLASGPALAGEPASITVGHIRLTPCIGVYNGYCGSITRQIDPEGHVSGKITIGFALFRHTDLTQKKLGTIIAQEGGPGFSTTGSRDGYVRLLTPLRDRRDILLIDKRGTGFSSAIDCVPLQQGGGLDALRACGEQLGKTAWLFSSRYAADDVAAVLDALETGPVDYYGDSYATYFGEVFATRHPHKLRTLILDSAYPAVNQDAFFRTEIRNGPTAFGLVCARSPSCSKLPGDAQQRFKTLLQSLREKSVTGQAPGAYDDTLKVTADPGALFTVVANAGNSYTVYRDIDAAARAYLDASDPLPLLRLVAEAVDGESLGGPYKQYSVGLQFAVECSDYAQLYNMRGTEASRHAQYKTSIVATPPKIYAPFKIGEALGAVENPEGLNQCQVWPRAPHWASPGMPIPAKPVFPNVPTLVLSGELDTVTSPTEGRETAKLFPHATFVLVPNAIHETAIGNAGYSVPIYGGDLAQCVGPMVIAFIVSGGSAPDQSCLAGIRPVRTVPAFATKWKDVFAAKAESGNAADQMRLRFASAVAETVGDAFARYSVDVSDKGPGLRGGSLRIDHIHQGYSITLDALQWTDDLAVSGVVDWNQVTGDVIATVTADATDHHGALTITWNDRQTNAQAAIVGKIDGQELAASRIAP